MNYASTTTDTVDLAVALINQPSITPDDSDCQTLIGERLNALGFDLTPLPSEGVSNLWATRGTHGPTLVFAGHTDVVPPGPDRQWATPPFQATIKQDYLFGRGAADMKGGLAAMITATERFVKQHPLHKGRIGFMITSDEEGPATHGTQHIIEHLMKKKEHIDYCIIGEPSSNTQLGDTIKIGRRGSLSGTLTVFGKQGHIAYPHLADNPIHRSLKALDECVNACWDQGNTDFDPTAFQLSSINADTGATNVIPGSLQAQFNFRYSPESCADTLKARVLQALDRYDLQYDIQWRHSGLPFYCPPNTLYQAAAHAIKQHTDTTTQASTTGGTSDGRFIASMGCDMIELGPINKTIHQANECIHLGDLNTLSAIYESTLQQLLIES